MSETYFMPQYPKLELDIKTPEGRKKCYKDFCMFNLKRYNFEKYVGHRTPWFNDKARKRLFLMHIDMNVYEALEEAYFEKDENTKVYESLNNYLEDKQDIHEIIERLGSFLKLKQEKAVLEEPPPYQQ